MTEDITSKTGQLSTVPQSSRALIQYHLSCLERRLEAYKALRPSDTLAGVDHYLAAIRDRVMLALPHLLPASLHLRNQNIAVNILNNAREKEEQVLQVVLLGLEHYEVLYELLAQAGLEFVREHFCFLHLYHP